MPHQNIRQNKMKGKWIVAVVVLIIIVAAVSLGAFYLLLPEKPERIEEIGGKYNVVINYWKDGHLTMKYTDETGEHLGHFLLNMNDSLDWIKTNTPEDTVFLCWWDYGHMIEGYAEREAVIKNPSEELLKSVVYPDEIKEFDSHERVVDVATALCATDADETLQTMQKYGASYVLVHTGDLRKGIAHWIFWTAGLDTTEYGLTFDSQTGDLDYTEKAKETLMIQLLENRDVEKLVLIYEDTNVKIYEIV
jgi:asparagine N-glycosylation enzyme membrane subunit Stt3